MKKAIFILFGSFLFSCGDIDSCTSDSDQGFMVVRFFDIETKEAKSVGFVFTAENSPYRFVFAADTTIIPADTNIVSGETVITLADTTIVSDSTVIALFLNPLDTMTSFLFDSDTIDHVLEVRYDVEYKIFDPDCDPSLTFVGLDTLRSTFDSTVVSGTVTNRQLSTNVEVYF